MKILIPINTLNLFEPYDANEIYLKSILSSIVSIEIFR